MRSFQPTLAFISYRRRLTKVLAGAARGKIREVRVGRASLTNVMEPLNQTMFQNRPWIFQQDSAPVHKVKTTQQWLENHVPEIISSDHWLSSSSDLNSFDYKL